MDDDAVGMFTAFTGASPDIARRYLGMTDNNSEQAIQLYFDSPDLASGAGEGASSTGPPVPHSSRPPPQASSAGQQDAQGVVQHTDSGAEYMEIDSDDDAAVAARAARHAELEDDAAMARKMQEELYTGGDASGGFDDDGVRAPIARTRETLIGGPDDGWTGGDLDAAVQHQMQSRNQPRLTGQLDIKIDICSYLLTTE